MVLLLKILFSIIIAYMKYGIVIYYVTCSDFSYIILFNDYDLSRGNSFIFHSAIQNVEMLQAHTSTSRPRMLQANAKFFLNYNLG